MALPHAWALMQLTSRGGVWFLSTLWLLWLWFWCYPFQKKTQEHWQPPQSTDTQGFMKTSTFGEFPPWFWSLIPRPGPRDSWSRIFPNNFRSKSLLVSLTCFGPVRILVPVLKLSVALVSEPLGHWPYHHIIQVLWAPNPFLPEVLWFCTWLPCWSGSRIQLVHLCRGCGPRSPCRETKNPSWQEPGSVKDSLCWVAFVMVHSVCSL